MAERHASGGLIARTVREALDAVVAPDVGERVLAQALVETQLVEVPEDADAFKAFLVPFLDVARGSLGDEVTAILTEELDRLAERALTSRLPPRRPSTIPRPGGRTQSTPPRSNQGHAGYRRTRDSDGAPYFRLTPQKIYAIPAAPVPKFDASDFGPHKSLPDQGRELSTPPDSTELPRGMASAMGMTDSGTTRACGSPPAILLCSDDPLLKQRISGWVSGRAEVTACDGLVQMLGALEGRRQLRTVVFLDCHNPAVRPMSLAALSEELPKGVEVVLWGATPHLVQELTQLFAPARGWMVCAPTLGVQEAVERCVDLIS